MAFLKIYIRNRNSIPLIALENNPTEVITLRRVITVLRKVNAIQKKMHMYKKAT